MYHDYSMEKILEDIKSPAKKNFTFECVHNYAKYI